MSKKDNKDIQSIDSSSFELIDILKGSCEEEENSSSTTNNPWEQRHLVMDQGILRLCRELIVPFKIFSIKEWLRLLDIYISEHDRLLYASISNFIFELNDNDFTAFVTNLDKVVEFAMTQDPPPNEQPETTSKRIRILLKFYDHVSLARMQFSLFSQQQADIDKSIERKLEPALAKSSKELTYQLVGLVAIFTALSFIVFGGISSLNSIFSALSGNNESILPILIVSIAWAFCILNLLFAFMYFVLRIIGKKEDTGKTGNLVQKYPMIFLSNYCLLSAMLFLLGSWFARNTGVGRGVYDFFISIGDCTFKIFLVLIIAIIVIIGYVLWRFYTATPPLKNEDESGQDKRSRFKRKKSTV